MKQLVVVNLTTKSTDWTPPALTFGESLTLGLRFEKDVSGQLVEPNLAINSATASIGLVDARPGGGRFALQVGADPGVATTETLPHDCSPAALAAAINARPAAVTAYGTAVAKKVDGSWLIRFGDGTVEVPLKVVDNSLWPVAFGRVSARQIDNAWLHELRLVQAPVAFTTASNGDVTLPPLPTITPYQNGGSSGALKWNEIQQLNIPPDFRGAYQFKKGLQRSPLVAPDASADEIKAALNSFGNGFNVTLPLSYHFLLEFTGDFGGVDQDLLEIVAAEAPVGDLIMTLPLDRVELAALLRGVTSATLPLEIRIVAQEDGGAAQEIVALFILVTIQRPLSFPELDEMPTTDWLRFPSPKGYRRLGAGDTLTGEKIYAITVGNGALTTFVITHALASMDVQVFVRLAGAPGTQLVDGTHFSATIDSVGQVTVTSLVGAPAALAWRVAVVAAKEITSWNAGLTVTEEQVINLPEDLATIDTRITQLEALLPANASLPAGTAPISGFKIEFPQLSEILFARDATGAAITDVTKLPTSRPYMLPAINKTSNDGELGDPIPAPSAGKLYTTTTAREIPGGGHIRRSLSKALGFVGSDGRINYPVTLSGTSDSYYPTPFERVIREEIINDKMFSPGGVLSLLFKISVQVINADTEAQWMLAIETGAVTDETTSLPNTFDTNLLNVDWNTANPVVLQRLILTSQAITHGFGCTMANNGGTMTANGLYYKRVIAVDSSALPAPNAKQFGIRIRLFNFDTKNSIPNARGWVNWALLPPDNGGTLGVEIA